MRHIETLRGKGTVTTKTSKTPVEYELQIYQREIPARTMENPSGTVPGMKQIHGWVRPFCGRLGERLTLEMEDTYAVQFFFIDNQGSISVSSGIEISSKAREIAMAAMELSAPTHLQLLQKIFERTGVKSDEVQKILNKLCNQLILNQWAVPPARNIRGG